MMKPDRNYVFGLLLGLVLTILLFMLANSSSVLVDMILIPRRLSDD